MLIYRQASPMLYLTKEASMKNTVAKLDHVNFTVAHFEDSVDWYKKIFNFELVEKGGSQDGRKWGILQSGDTMLAITEHPEKKLYLGEEFHQTFHFGLRLVDKEEWQQKISEYHLETFYSSPIEYPHSTSWYVKDPTGNKIEVAVWKNDQVQFPEQGRSS